MRDRASSKYLASRYASSSMATTGSLSLTSCRRHSRPARCRTSPRRINNRLAPQSSPVNWVGLSRAVERRSQNSKSMHPWHDTYIDDASIATAFPVVIEIPKRSTNKYELDKETGLLRLDRALHSAVYYPADYGFIPRTYCDDGDPLDVLVLGDEPVYPLTIVEARAIGVMRMRDEKGVDDKIVAVSVRDPAYADYRDKAQLPAYILRQIRRFFEDYKVLENKQVSVEDLLGPEDAVGIIADALQLYKQLRRGQLAKH